MSQVLLAFITNLILIKDHFSFPWNYGVAYGQFLWASSCISEWRIDFGVIFRFSVNVTSSWWRPQPARGVCVSWNRSPSSLVLWHFSEFSHSSDFVASRPVSGDEPKTVYEGCYETKNTSIFAWSLILGVGHYRWLYGLIHYFHPNNKADYLIRTIQRILDFL